MYALVAVQHEVCRVASHNEPERLGALRVALGTLQERAGEVGISPTLEDQLKRLIEYEPRQPQDWSILVDRSFELVTNLINELTDYLFFVVPPTSKWIYLDPQTWFGVTTVETFQGIEQDVRDSCQCFALGQWTATVFHCMRVLEAGLHSLAADLGLPGAEHDDWKNILDRIEKKVRAMEQEPKSAEKIERVRYYSEAAAQFRLFKDAFRNHVSHYRSHVSYDEQAAHKILVGVRDFMEALAKKPS